MKKDMILSKNLAKVTRGKKVKDEQFRSKQGQLCNKEGWSAKYHDGPIMGVYIYFLNYIHDSFAPVIVRSQYRFLWKNKLG